MPNCIISLVTAASHIITVCYLNTYLALQLLSFVCSWQRCIQGWITLQSVFDSALDLLISIVLLVYISCTHNLPDTVYSNTVVHVLCLCPWSYPHLPTSQYSCLMFIAEMLDNKYLHPSRVDLAQRYLTCKVGSEGKALSQQRASVSGSQWRTSET